MSKRLQDFQTKRCLTASGWLVKDGKVLLVKHKMLGIWLAPGGHVEKDELPHRAAEREFFEETGVKAHAISAYPVYHTIETENLPMPFTYNLHWINKPGEKTKKRDDGSVCGQHYVFGFFVEAIGPIKLDDSDTGIDAVQWFSENEIDTLDTSDTIRSEAHFVFKHYPRQ
ncbi:MAG TPA: NUDIX domain-containing protein [Candidatus Saccharimonadia bacterium]|nr:NUDIX domain-containing protein [Candidatus Saccharimonadia bacterium]